MDPEGGLSLFDTLKIVCDIITDYLPDLLNSKIVLLFGVDHLPCLVIASIGIDTMIILEEWDVSPDFVTTFVDDEYEMIEQRCICFSDFLECIRPPTPSNSSDNEIENIVKAQDVIDNVRLFFMTVIPGKLQNPSKFHLTTAEIIELIHRSRHASPSP